MKIPRYGAIFFIILSCSPIIYIHYYFYYVQQLRPQDETIGKLKDDKNEKFEKLREEIRLVDNFDKKNDKTIREFNLEKLDKEYNINWYASDKRPKRNSWTKMSIRDSNSSIFESWFKNISPFYNLFFNSRYMYKIFIVHKIFLSRKNLLMIGYHCIQIISR